MQEGHSTVAINLLVTVHGFTPDVIFLLFFLDICHCFGAICSQILRAHNKSIPTIRYYSNFVSRPDFPYFITSNKIMCTSFKLL